MGEEDPGVIFADLCQFRLFPAPSVSGFELLAFNTKVDPAGALRLFAYKTGTGSSVR